MKPNSIFAVLVLLLLGGCAAAGQRAPAAAPLRVLVYNIHAGKDAAGTPNLERVAEVVRTSRADVVLLQEVDRETERSGREDQLATLEKLTALHGVFGRTLPYQGGQYGIAILSRWPIEADSLHLLPISRASADTARAPEPRGALHASVRTPGGRVHLVSTHLDASRGDAYRLQQIAGVIELAKKLRDSGELTLIGGDFNSTPDSPTVGRMTASGWRDAWIGCGAGAGPTIPDDAPVRRIDDLFLPPTLRCDSAEVRESRASDHRPVLFVITPR
jgi:endonuclease/exonuclease/phosphatase family metal-dependent hydrolase